MKTLCPACRGRKNVMGLGYALKICETCNGIGEIIRDLSQAENDGEQNNIKDSKDISRKENVDSGKKNHRKRGRKVQREISTVGTGESHLPEREESWESSEKVGCDESKEKQSC